MYNGGGQLVAEYSTALAQTPQVSYLTADHLGSARVITNQNGAVTTRKDYLAFGDEASSAQRTANPNYDTSETRKGYTGYEKDDESGLEFAQARYYNATHGRFTSVDPLTASANVKNPQTFNRYSYVLNSPYKFTDPLGLLSVTTSACGQWCSNSGPWVDGSAFRGTDTYFGWIQDGDRAGDRPQNPNRNQGAHRPDSCRNCSAQDTKPPVPIFQVNIEQTVGETVLDDDGYYNQPQSKEASLIFVGLQDQFTGEFLPSDEYSVTVEGNELQSGQKVPRVLYFDSKTAIWLKGTPDPGIKSPHDREESDGWKGEIIVTGGGFIATYTVNATVTKPKNEYPTSTQPTVTLNPSAKRIQPNLGRHRDTKSPKNPNNIPKLKTNINGKPK